MARRSRTSTFARGFTLLELVIALAVLSVLVTMAVPVVKLQMQRQKESDLRAALRTLRDGIDAYKAAVTDGRVRSPADASGYPPGLETLVEGVEDAKDPGRKRLYFLRRIPRDPMHVDSGVPAASTWGRRSYASPSEAPLAGADVFDVYSLSEGVGINGVPYREW